MRPTNRKHEQYDGACLVADGLVNDFEQGARFARASRGDIGEAKEQDDQEDEAAASADEDSKDHRARCGQVRILHLFHEVGAAVVSDEPKCALQKSKDPGDTIWPTGAIDQLSENEGAGLIVGRGTSEAGDCDDRRSEQTPLWGRRVLASSAGSVEDVSLFAMKNSQRALPC